MNRESELSIVVLPLPVPPEIRMLIRASTAACTLFGRSCMRRAIQIMLTHVAMPARNRYSTALLIEKMPRWTQLSSLNSFCGWNSVLRVPLKP